jgi:hypothetical protein
MGILLQSTVGGFSADFIARLPMLEQAMIAQGLEPSDFIFSKDRAVPASIPFIGPLFYEYTVFVDDAHFTVTEPNDARFLEFIQARIAAPDEQAAVVKASGLLARLKSWMNQPI